MDTIPIRIRRLLEAVDEAPESLKGGLILKAFVLAQSHGHEPLTDALVALAEIFRLPDEDRRALTTTLAIVRKTVARELGAAESRPQPLELPIFGGSALVTVEAARTLAAMAHA